MLKLNLGCGEKILEGYENIDIRPLPGVIQADVRNLSYSENSIDEILAIDVLEHLSHHETVATLIHWMSLLKPGGKLYLQGPCLPVIAGHGFSSNDPEVLLTTIRLLYGNQNYPENTHRTCLHPILLRKWLVLDLGIPEENIYFSSDLGFNVKVLIIKPEASHDSEGNSGTV